MAKAPTTEPAKQEEVAVECGIIMPIADMTGYPPNHWEAMLELISRGIRKAGMTPEPVWANGPADVLQERIVRNLYEQPFAVCDVSGLNPNVMLELGIRLAFGKPTIIVNDGVIRAPFDIGPSEYVPYDKSLHYKAAEDFVERLTARIQAVKAVVDQNTYRPYIKTFGPIELGAPGSEAVPLGQALLDQLDSIKSEMRNLKTFASRPVQDALASASLAPSNLRSTFDRTGVFMFNVPPEFIGDVKKEIEKLFPDATVHQIGKNTLGVATSSQSPKLQAKIEWAIQDLIREADPKYGIVK